MSKASAALLLGYMASQLEDLELLIAKIGAAEPSSDEKAVYLGYLLHNFYCALEDLFQEVAKTFENRVEDPARFHAALLKRMTIDVPQVRPRVVSRQSYKVLSELRAFRHVFRHAYGYDLAPEKLQMLKTDLANGWNDIHQEIKVFQSFLEALTKR
jgi:hypothetical protein